MEGRVPMYRYLRNHEAAVRAAIDAQGAGSELEQVHAYHLRQIAWMQHERMIHLIVTMFVGLFMVLTILFVTLHPTVPLGVLALVLLGLFSAYIVHYFRLENGVQRWYLLANRLDEKMGRVCR